MRFLSRCARPVMPDRCKTTAWKGVSYIGNSARMFLYCFPPVQSPVPFQPCNATPVVVIPRCATDELHVDKAVVGRLGIDRDAELFRQDPCERIAVDVIYPARRSRPQR